MINETDYRRDRPVRTERIADLDLEVWHYDGDWVWAINRHSTRTGSLLWEEESDITFTDPDAALLAANYRAMAILDQEAMQDRRATHIITKVTISAPGQPGDVAWGAYDQDGLVQLFMSSEAAEVWYYGRAIGALA